MMHKGFAMSLGSVLALLLLVSAPRAHAVGPAFTYQGQVQLNGTLQDGTCDLQFSLFDALASGGQIGSTQTVPNLEVTNGVFTAQLNGGNEFGPSPFNGADRWLQIAVRCPAGSGSYSPPLTPRQQLTATPYASYASTAGSANDVNCSGCVTDQDVGSGIQYSKLSGAPTSLPPSGSAGGALSGTYPNPTLNPIGAAQISPGQVVKSLNGITDSVTLAAGTNISIAPSGNTLTISSSGSAGTITGVTAGDGLTGGGSSGNVTLGVNFAGSGSATKVARSDHDHLGDTWSGNPSHVVRPLTTVYDPVLTVKNTGSTSIRGESRIGLSATADNAGGIAVDAQSLNGIALRAESASGTAAYLDGRVRMVSDAGPTTSISVGDRYRDNAVVAWAKITAAGTVDDSGKSEFGVKSVTKNVAGSYTIVLDSAASGAGTLIPMAVAEIDSQPIDAASTRVVSVNQRTTDTLDVYINRGSGTAVDNDFVFLATAR